MPNPFDIRPMTSADLPGGHALSQAVRWPHTLSDWRFVLELGEGIVAERDGRIVGTTLWWRPDRAVARIGMVIVDPTLQRAGLGRTLMDRSLAAVGATSVMLTATTAGEPLYTRLGFDRVGAVFQHQGVPSGVPRAPGGLRHHIRLAAPADIATLIELDARATGSPRPDVIRTLFAVADTALLLRDSAPVGFAVRRHFGRGLLVGPLVAETREQAETLLSYWIADRPQQFLRIDVPETAGLGPFLEAHGLAVVDQALTMVRGPLPAPRGPQCYLGLVNQALG